MQPPQVRLLSAAKPSAGLVVSVPAAAAVAYLFLLHIVASSPPSRVCFTSGSSPGRSLQEGSLDAPPGRSVKASSPRAPTASPTDVPGDDGRAITAVCRRTAAMRRKARVLNPPLQQAEFSALPVQVQYVAAAR